MTFAPKRSQKHVRTMAHRHVEPGLALRRSVHAARYRVSGNFRGTTKNDLHFDAGMTKHGDQDVDAESVDLPPDEITDSQLGDTKQFRSLRLGQRRVSINWLRRIIRSDRILRFAQLRRRRNRGGGTRCP